MLSKKILPLVILSVCSFSAYCKNTQKDSKGWYAGGFLGSSSVNIEHTGDRNNKGDTEHLGIYGGYNFTDWFGLSGQFFKTNSLENPNITGGYEVSALSVVPKFNFKINDMFSIYAKVGLSSLIYEETDYDGIFYDNHWGGLGHTLGTGVEFTFNRNLNVRFAYDYYKATVSNGDDYLFFSFSDELDLTSKNISLAFHYQF